VISPFRKGAKGIVLLLFKKKRTEENSTFPKPLSTYKGDVIYFGQRPPYVKVLVKFTEPVPLRGEL